MAELTPKQKAFVQEYLVDLNATQAAIRAGYSTKTAYSIGQENLNKLEIQAAIQKAQQERIKRTQITQDMVVRELAKLGFSNIGKYAKWEGDKVTLINSEELSEDDLACVSEISQNATQNGNSVRFKLHDKRAALELLGRHLGMFRDNVNHTGEVQVIFNIPRPQQAEEDDLFGMEGSE